MTVQAPVVTTPPSSSRSPRARFISRGRLAGRSLYWLGWLAFSRRAVVTSGVEREVYALGIGALRLVASASLQMVSISPVHNCVRAASTAAR